MSRLMRTSEIAKRPVVTYAGDDVAQIKDIVYSAGGGAVGGFTLAGRGLFAGPLKQSLAWTSVAALGADAVMIRDEESLEPTEAVLDASASSGGSGGNVLGSQVLTDGGTELGTVVDVILEVTGEYGGQCDVVGYEIEASEALSTQGKHGKGTKLLIPAAGHHRRIRRAPDGAGQRAGTSSSRISPASALPSTTSAGSWAPTPPSPKRPRPT